MKKKNKTEKKKIVEPFDYFIPFYWWLVLLSPLDWKFTVVITLTRTIYSCIELFLLELWKFGIKGIANLSNLLDGKRLSERQRKMLLMQQQGHARVCPFSCAHVPISFFILFIFFFASSFLSMSFHFCHSPNFYLHSHIHYWRLERRQQFLFRLFVSCRIWSKGMWRLQSSNTRVDGEGSKGEASKIYIRYTHFVCISIYHPYLLFIWFSRIQFHFRGAKIAL